MPDPSQEPPPVDLAALAKLSVKDSEGDVCRMDSLWRNQKAVLVFLPPLRTQSARDRTAQAHASLHDLRSCGAEVYLIGPSFPDTAEQFEETQTPACELYVDPEAHVFRAAGLPKEAPLKNTTTRILKGIRKVLGATADDLAKGVELGGVLVVLPPGKLLYAAAAKDLDAPLPLDEARQALARAGWSHLG